MPKDKPTIEKRLAEIEISILMLAASLKTVSDGTFSAFERIDAALENHAAAINSITNTIKPPIERKDMC